MTNLITRFNKIPDFHTTLPAYTSSKTDRSYSQAWKDWCSQAFQYITRQSLNQSGFSNPPFNEMIGQFDKTLEKAPGYNIEAAVSYLCDVPYDAENGSALEKWLFDMLSIGNLPEKAQTTAAAQRLKDVHHLGFKNTFALLMTGYKLASLKRDDESLEGLRWKSAQNIFKDRLKKIVDQSPLAYQRLNLDNLHSFRLNKDEIGKPLREKFGFSVAPGYYEKYYPLAVRVGTVGGTVLAALITVYGGYKAVGAIASYLASNQTPPPPPPPDEPAVNLYKQRFARALIKDDNKVARLMEECGASSIDKIFSIPFNALLEKKNTLQASKYAAKCYTKNDNIPQLDFCKDIIENVVNPLSKINIDDPLDFISLLLEKGTSDSINDANMALKYLDLKHSNAGNSNEFYEALFEKIKKEDHVSALVQKGVEILFEKKPNLATRFVNEGKPRVIQDLFKKYSESEDNNIFSIPFHILFNIDTEKATKYAAKCYADNKILKFDFCKGIMQNVVDKISIEASLDFVSQILETGTPASINGVKEILDHLDSRNIDVFYRTLLERIKNEATTSILVKHGVSILLKKHPNLALSFVEGCETGFLKTLFRQLDSSTTASLINHCLTTSSVPNSAPACQSKIEQWAKDSKDEAKKVLKQNLLDVDLIEKMLANATYKDIVEKALTDKINEEPQKSGTIIQSMLVSNNPDTQKFANQFASKLFYRDPAQAITFAETCRNHSETCRLARIRAISKIISDNTTKPFNGKLLMLTSEELDKLDPNKKNEQLNSFVNKCLQHQSKEELEEMLEETFKSLMKISTKLATHFAQDRIKARGQFPTITPFLYKTIDTLVKSDAALAKQLALELAKDKSTTPIEIQEAFNYLLKNGEQARLFAQECNAGKISRLDPLYVETALNEKYPEEADKFSDYMYSLIEPKKR